MEDAHIAYSMESNIHIKVIILAGGLGTRIRCIIGDSPKAMARIGGVPLLEWTIRRLREQGMLNIDIHVWYQSEVIVRHFGDGGSFGVKIQYHFLPLDGTATVVKSIVKDWRGLVLVIYGDIFTDMDLLALVEFHVKRKAVATIGLYRAVDPRQCGIVDVNSDERVISFVEKPVGLSEGPALANCGIYVLSREFIDEMPGGVAWDFGYNIFPEAVKRERQVYGFQVPRDVVLIDIGTPANYALARRPESLAGFQITQQREKSDAISASSHEA